MPQKAFNAAKPLMAMVAAASMLVGGMVRGEELPEFKSAFCKKRENQSVNYDQLRTNIVTPANVFGLRLFHQLRASLPPGDNLIFSPVSAWMVLSMLSVGAEKETQKELEKVLGVRGSREAFAKGCGDFLAVMICSYPDSSLNLSIVNGLFRQEGKPFRSPFLRTLSSEFDTEPSDVNFAKAPAQACKSINDWVSDQTGGKITNLISERAVTDDTKLVLVNALRLKDSWQWKFQPSSTKLREFFAPGKTKKVPMMHRVGGEGDYLYADFGEYRVASLRSASGDVDLIILLPSKRDGLSSLEQRLNHAQIAEVFSKLKRRRVNLTLPKFKTDGDHQLVEELRGLGLKQMFVARKADFSGIDGGVDDLYVSAIVQKAMIEVDEKGIEAAAATAAVMTAGSARPEPTKPVDFVVDRPFLYLLRHTATNALLFMGRISDP